MIERLKAKIAQLKSDERGATAILFGLMILPVFLAAGVGLDYARATNVRVGLQAAVDAAILGAARDGVILTKAQMEQRAVETFNANFHKSEATIESVVATRNDAAKTITLTARARVNTTLMRLGGINDMPVVADGVAAWGRNTIELALALDNTGSMNDAGKMTALKTAVRNLLTMMENASVGDPSMIKISMVPFNTQVQASRNDLKSGSFSLLGFIGGLIGGDACMADRDQPNDTNVLDIGSILFPGVNCQYGTQLATVMPLTNNYNKLRKTVDDMTPVGNTNVTIGTNWALASLDPNSQLSGAKPFGTERLLKFMIVLTDGDNTENRFERCSSLPYWDQANCTKRIDARTAAACTEAKNKGITVYSILVINGSADLLRACASSPDKFKMVSKASDLDAVFRDIANQILGVRITS